MPRVREAVEYQQIYEDPPERVPVPALLEQPKTQEKRSKKIMREVFEKYAAVVFFDTETTGLDYENDQIIELAAIRVIQTKSGRLMIADSQDIFVQLPEGQKLPENIVKLTGITDEILENEGVPENEAAAIFANMIRDDFGPVLLVAHNAQFDLLFALGLLRRNPCYVPADDGMKMIPTREREKMLAAADYLDSLTVYKDRRPYPHKLANAITAYKLEDKVQNSHRAIDDVWALYEVVKAMDAERADLLRYVNLFGYNPKYGVTGRRIKKVQYWPQRFNKYMAAPNATLPALAKNIFPTA